MPYAFGATGGTAVTSPAGALVACAAGDGRQATNLEYNLAVCKQCHDNIKYQENLVGSGKVPAPLTFIIANKNNNLSKR